MNAPFFVPTKTRILLMVFSYFDLGLSALPDLFPAYMPVSKF
jgi:hypothetical protein